MSSATDGVANAPAESRNESVAVGPKNPPFGAAAHIGAGVELVDLEYRDELREVPIETLADSLPMTIENK